ncbi:hypothetical protein CMI48_03675 [Candidatus Pacearchaeota archaeon]|nr:hypothetical protein [Candidatus Pacearchaeota archaeon]|tara:strand:- start:10 stop:276 length:267 start_codon:yes stop_codon:yes gene_type:complete
MVLTLDKVRPIKKKFQKEHWRDYFVGSGISNLAVQRRRHEFPLAEGETLEDHCISVSLREEPPESEELISSYEGVRIFYRVVGPVRAL